MTAAVLALHCCKKWWFKANKFHVIRDLWIKFKAFRFYLETRRHPF